MRGWARNAGEGCLVLLLRWVMLGVRGFLQLYSVGGVIAQGPGGRLRPASLVRMSRWLPEGIPVKGDDLDAEGAADRIARSAGEARCLGVVVALEIAAIGSQALEIGAVLSAGAGTIVLTGARVPMHRVGTDAPGNIADAIRVACEAGARGLGVLVVLGGRVHAGSEVVCEDAEGGARVRSEPWGPIGLVSERGVEIVRRPVAGPG